MFSFRRYYRQALLVLLYGWTVFIYGQNSQLSPISRLMDRQYSYSGSSISSFPITDFQTFGNKPIRQKGLEQIRFKIYQKIWANYKENSTVIPIDQLVQNQLIHAIERGNELSNSEYEFELFFALFANEQGEIIDLLELSCRYPLNRDKDDLFTQEFLIQFKQRIESGLFFVGMFHNHPETGLYPEKAPKLFHKGPFSYLYPSLNDFEWAQDLHHFFSVHLESYPQIEIKGSRFLFIGGSKTVQHQKSYAVLLHQYSGQNPPTFESMKVIITFPKKYQSQLSPYQDRIFHDQDCLYLEANGEEFDRITDELGFEDAQAWHIPDFFIQKHLITDPLQPMLLHGQKNLSITPTYVSSAKDLADYLIENLKLKKQVHECRCAFDILPLIYSQMGRSSANLLSGYNPYDLLLSIFFGLNEIQTLSDIIRLFHFYGLNYQNVIHRTLLIKQLKRRLNPVPPSVNNATSASKLFETIKKSLNIFNLSQ